MKKKLLTVALTAAMALSSVFSAFAEDVDCTGWWVAHSAGTEITTEGVEIDFHTQSYETAKANWNTPLYVVYAADSQFAGGAEILKTPGYTEYFVMRSDGYGWSAKNDREYNTNKPESLATVGISVEKTGEPSSTDEWAKWLATNKAGVDCTIKATKKADNKVIVECTNNGITSNATITVDAGKTIYLSVSGEFCKITDLTVSSLKTEESSKPSEPVSTSKPSAAEPESTSKPSPDKVAETSKPSPDKVAETSKPSPDKEAETSSSAEKETTTKPADKETTTVADENAVVVIPVTEEEVKAIQEAIEIAGAVEGAKIAVKVPTTEEVAKAQEIITKAIAAADKTADGIAISVLKDKKPGEIAVIDLTLTDKDGNPIQPEEGKKVKITLKTDDIKALKDAKYVAAFRVADDKLVSLGIVEVKDGKFTIETDHFSTYVFTAATEQQFKDYTAAVKADASVNDASGNKTGDSSPVMPLVVLAVVALGGVVAVVASKKRA